MPTTPGARELPAGAIRTNCCDTWWTGALTCHCAGCHHTFTAIGAFDRHRRNGKCGEPATMRFSGRSKHAGKPIFVDAGRAYPCWMVFDAREWSGPESASA